MIYKASYIINSVLSCIFIILGVYIFTTIEKIFDTDAIIALGFLFIIYGIFLWLDYICAIVYKHNKKQISISEKIKKQGKIISITAVFLAVAVLFFTLTAAVSFFAYSSMHRQWPFIILYLITFLLTGVTTIINVIFFSKKVKQNKFIIDEQINDIGS